MAEAIRMPLLSDTMKEGVIADWLKKVGDEVKADDVIAEVETDKATMEVTPYVDGTLLYIAADKGQGVPVNGIMAIIGKPGEDFQAILDAEKGNSQSAPAQNNTAPQQPAQPAQQQNAPAQPPQPAAPQAQQSAPAQQAQPAQQSVAPTQSQQPGATHPAQQQSAAPAQPQQSGAPQGQPAAAPNPADATVVRMPLLSDTMKEGKIVAWNKKVGDIVKGDDVIAEVETDKATMEVMPYVDGTLLYIGVKEGEAAPVNGIIAIIGKPGTDVTPFLNEGGAPAQGGSAGQQLPQAESQPPSVPASSQAQQSRQPQSQAQHADHPASQGDDRVKASPLARKLAADKGIDIHQLAGSGDNGRIIKRDIDTYQQPAQQAQPQPSQPQAAQAEPRPQQQSPAPAATQQQPQKAAAQVPAFTPASGTEGHTDIPLTQMRRIIAQRLAESKFSAPHFYLRMTITMDKAIEARKAMNDVSPVKISFNDMVIKACAMALRKHPQVNSSWMGDFIRQNHHISIGTAVAVDEGLIVPVVKFADQKTLSQISDEAGKLIEKARTKKIQPQEFTGNTFTISNLGMMDIDEFTAIINPPDSCILAVGKIAATPVVENGEVVVRQLMKLTLSCDHRVVDGAVGSKFLQTLKAYLENPVTMLV